METIILLLIIAILIVRSIMQEEDDNWINKAQRKNENRFNYLNQNIIHDKSEDQPKWYPTGWYYNEETKSWEPPDYIKKEATDKWRWDEERQIWIDKEKEERLEKYYAYRKSQGLPPTYEEWKSAKLAEERKKREEHKNQHPEK